MKTIAIHECGPSFWLNKFHWSSSVRRTVELENVMKAVCIHAMEAFAFFYKSNSFSLWRSKVPEPFLSCNSSYDSLYVS